MGTGEQTPPQIVIMLGTSTQSRAGSRCAGTPRSHQIGRRLIAEAFPIFNGCAASDVAAPHVAPGPGAATLDNAHLRSPISDSGSRLGLREADGDAGVEFWADLFGAVLERVNHAVDDGSVEAAGSAAERAALFWSALPHGANCARRSCTRLTARERRRCRTEPGTALPLAGLSDRRPVATGPRLPGPPVEPWIWTSSAAIWHVLVRVAAGALLCMVNSASVCTSTFTGGAPRGRSRSIPSSANST